MTQRKEQAMDQVDAAVNKIRAAIEDRALYLALLYRSFTRYFPADQVEKAAREAIFEYGQLKGQRDTEKMTPAKWVDHHVAKGSAAVFESRIVKEQGGSQQQMTYCPLVQAWKKLGCSPEEIDLFCDIAMEVDRGRAAYHGVRIEIPKRIGKGDPYCCLVLRDDEE